MLRISTGHASVPRTARSICNFTVISLRSNGIHCKADRAENGCEESLLYFRKLDFAWATRREFGNSK